MAYDPSQGPAMPPEIMQMMADAAGAQPAQAAGGAPGVAGIDDPRYDEVLAQLEQILQAEPDEADSSELAKHIAGLYKLRANRVKEEDAAMGGKMSPRLMRRSYGA